MGQWATWCWTSVQRQRYNNMCKIAFSTGAIGKASALKFIESSNAIFAKDQKDGFGFVAAGQQGLASGWYLSPSNYFGFGNQGYPRMFLGQQQEVGSIPRIVSFMMAHGRTSTNNVCLWNVHPFESNGLYLIHNGILKWSGKSDPPACKHDCDSEQFLNWWAANRNVDAIKDNWSGYGAFVIFDSKNGCSTLIKCSMANLSGIRRDNARGWVFSTFERDLYRIVKTSRIAVSGRAFSVPSCVIEFSATGEVTSEREFPGFGAMQYDATKFVSSYGSGAKYGRSHIVSRELFPDWDGRIRNADEIDDDEVARRIKQYDDFDK